MIYASIAASIGISLYITAAAEDWKWVLAVGMLLYFAGMILGNVIENRLEKRIKELEDKLKEA